ncbi:MAG: sigma-70 family RNA polymerase sigma factor [Clostridia bacterium]
MEAVTTPKGTNEETLQRMIAQYQTELLRMCYLYLQDTSLAEDAVQETFLRAYRAIQDFRGESSEKTWLIRISINICRDMQRSAWLRHIDRRITPDMLPEASVAFEAKDEELIMSVMNLPVKLREAILLYYFQNMSVKEIAASLGISSPTVSNRLKRATKKLRIVLEGGHYYE